MMSMSFWLAVPSEAEDDGALDCELRLRGESCEEEHPGSAKDTGLEGIGEGYRESPGVSGVMVSEIFRPGGVPPTITKSNFGWRARTNTLAVSDSMVRVSRLISQIVLFEGPDCVRASPFTRLFTASSCCFHAIDTSVAWSRSCFIFAGLEYANS